MDLLIGTITFFGWSFIAACVASCMGIAAKRGDESALEEPKPTEKLPDPDPCGIMRIAAMRKDGHTYIVLYEPFRETEAIRAIGNYAADPELDFCWMDALQLNYRILQMKTEENVTVSQ